MALAIRAVRWLVAVLFFVPLPPWMIIEQAACGALLLATASIIFHKGAAGPSEGRSQRGTLCRGCHPGPKADPLLVIGPR